MSVEIVKVYKQEVPALRFIGKKYGDNDRIDGMFRKYWGDFFQNGWFDLIVKQTDKDLKLLFEDGDAAIGLMREKDGEPFEYWIGRFMPDKTPVPEGFEHKDFPKSTLGVCWLSGKEPEIYKKEAKCWEKLSENGYEGKFDSDGACWFMERYVGSRFEPDEEGNIILDICFYVK